MSRAQKATKYRADQAQLEDFIVGALPKVRTSLDQLNSLAPTAEQAQRIHHKLRSNGRYFYESLRVPRRNGQLKLETILSESRALAYEPILARGGVGSVYFGEFWGSKLFQAQFSPHDDLNRIILDCSSLPRAPDQLEAIDALGKMTDKHKNEIEHKIRTICINFKKLSRNLEEFYSFFDKGHILRLNQWASHPQNPMPFSCEFREHTTTVGVELFGGQDRVSLSKSSVQESLPAVLPFEID